MKSIVRFDPFSELATISPLLTDPFIGDMFNPFIIRSPSSAVPQIKIDVKEADNQYLVNAEIPGVSREDIHVNIDGKRISISAEFKQEKNSGERMLCTERSYGTATRAFSLDAEVDSNEVKASYSDGVLELTLPKKSGTGKREIAIT